MKDKWIYHKPLFEGDKYNEILLKYAPWSGLRTFAYDLVAFTEPGIIVELGSHYGCSSFAFLQAIKDEGLSTEFYAIDTWEGDSYTNYSDVENVYQMYSMIESDIFSDQSAHKIRKRFEDALDSFRDRSIDILHIDGSHAYEDVKADYESWFGKVKDDGIILLHDIGSDLVNGELMGSHFFWRELKEQGAFTIELMFSCGLGIVAKRKEVIELLERSFSSEYYQHLNNIQDTVNKEAVRESFFRIRDLESYITDLKKEKAVLTEHLRKYEEDASGKALYIARLEKYRKAAEKQNKSQDKAYKKVINEKESYIEELTRQISELNDFAESKDTYAEELKQDLKNIQDFLENKETYIADLEKQISGLNAFSDSKDQYSKELLKQIDSLNKLVDDKENYINELKNVIHEYKLSEVGKNKYISELEQERESLNDFSARKEDYINELRQQIDEIKAFAESKERYIEELLQQIDDYNVFAEGKEQYISELEKTVSELKDELSGKKSLFQKLTGKNGLPQ